MTNLCTDSLNNANQNHVKRNANLIAPYLNIFGIKGFQRTRLQGRRDRARMWECYGGEDKDEPKQWEVFDHFVCDIPLCKRELRVELLYLINSPTIYKEIRRKINNWPHHKNNLKKKNVQGSDLLQYPFLVKYSTRLLIHHLSWPFLIGSWAIIMRRGQ